MFDATRCRRICDVEKEKVDMAVFRNSLTQSGWAIKAKPQEEPKRSVPGL